MTAISLLAVEQEVISLHLATGCRQDEVVEH